MYKDESTYEKVMQISDIMERFIAAMEYTEDFPYGLHINDMKSLIARDSTEVLNLIAEAEYERDYGYVRDCVEGVYFLTSNNGALVISIPDKNGQGYGKMGDIGSWSFASSPILFSYTVKEKSRKLICTDLDKGGRFTIEVFDDAAYFEAGGTTIGFQNNPAGDEWPDTMKKVIAQCKQLQSK